MPEKIKCCHCGKESSLEHWFITTSYVMRTTKDKISINPRPALFFCPCCGLPNTIWFEKTQDEQAEEASEKVNEESEAEVTENEPMDANEPKETPED